MHPISVMVAKFIRLLRPKDWGGTSTGPHETNQKAL